VICGKSITFKELWLKEQFKKLRESEIADKFTNQELKEFLLNKYSSRRVSEGRFFNNSTSDNEIMTQEQFINKYLNEPLILSGYACLYKNQNDSVNISSKALENLGEMRKFNKKKMEAAEHGSDDYVFYRILQLTYKVLMNSYYGILGEKNSVFFNPYVQNSITMTRTGFNYDCN